MNASKVLTRVPAISYRTADIAGQSIFYREAGSPDAPVLLSMPENREEYG